MILKLASSGLLGLALVSFAGCDSTPPPPATPTPAPSTTPAPAKGAPASTAAPKTNIVPD